MIKLEGAGLERFVNRAMEAGLSIWNVQRTGRNTMTANVSVGQLLRPAQAEPEPGLPYPYPGKAWPAHRPIPAVVSQGVGLGLDRRIGGAAAKLPVCVVFPLRGLRPGDPCPAHGHPGGDGHPGGNAPGPGDHQPAGQGGDGYRPTDRLGGSGTQRGGVAAVHPGGGPGACRVGGGPAPKHLCRPGRGHPPDRPPAGQGPVSGPGTRCSRGRS